MLIEALKIFYPTHYLFVKENPHFFLSSYGGHMEFGDSREYKERAKLLQEHLNELSKDLSKREKESVFNLLSELFPRLNEAFNNNFLHDGVNIWFKHKRIVSSSYFKRYFSYTVIEGELSDIQFDLFFNSINDSSIGDLTKQIEKLIEDSSVDNFLHKVRSLEEELPWNISSKLSLSLAQMGDRFPVNDSFYFSFGMDGALSQAAIFIYQVMKNHGNKDECFELASFLMLNPVPLKFSFEVTNWIGVGDTEEEKIFSPDQYLKLESNLRRRAVEDSKGEPLFLAYPDHSGYLLRIWRDENPKELQKYLKKILDRDPKKIKDLLWSFTPTARSSNHPEPFKSTFTKEYYEYVTTFLDKKYIHKILENSFGEELSKEKAKFNDRYDYSQTDINILRQYQHWYNLDNDQSE